MESSSSSHNSDASIPMEDRDWDSDSTQESTVFNPRSLNTHITFKVKGGGVDDMGKEYTMTVDNNLEKVFLNYASFAQLTPSNLRLYHRNNLIRPTDTPFQLGFLGDDIVLAYGKDGKPISTFPIGTSATEHIYFTITELTTTPYTRTWRARKVVTVDAVVKRWALEKGEPYHRTRLILDKKDLWDGETLGEVGVVDGAVVYAHVEAEPFDRRGKRT